MNMSLIDLNNSKARQKDVSEQVLRLHKAAASGSPDDIKAMIGSGTDIDARDGMKMTPLMSAAYNEKLENIATLLEAGADIKAVNYWGCTVLHLNCNNKGMDCTLALVSAGADTEVKDGLGNKPIHMASIYGNKEMMEYYISQSESLEVLGADGCTPLLTAAEYGSLANLKTLIDRGADIHARNVFEDNLLLLAAGNSNSEVLRYVLPLGFSIESKDELGRTPLCSASMNNVPENVKMLLDAGADIGIRDKNGVTLIDMIAECGESEEVINLLAKTNSFVKLRDYKGQTALHVAASQNLPISAKALLDAGADINCRDNDGYTPILIAAELNNIKMVKLLFEAGADTGIATNFGRSLISLTKSSMEDSMGDESFNFLKAMGVQDQSTPNANISTAESIPADKELQTVCITDDGSRTTVLDREAFSDWASPFADKCTPVKFGDVLEKLGVTVEMDEENWAELAELMTNLGFGLAPHRIMTEHFPHLSEPVHLYRTADNHDKLDGESEFVSCVEEMGIGAIFLSHGSFSSKEVGAALRDALQSRDVRNESTMAGIQAHIAHFLISPPGEEFFEDLFEFEPNVLKGILRILAVKFARIVNAGKAKKLAAMESFYKFLELDPKLAHSDLQSGAPEVNPYESAKLSAILDAMD